MSGTAQTTGNRDGNQPADTGGCQPRPHLSAADIGAPLYPSDNEWGIPTLRLDRQATTLDLPVARWGRERRKSRMRGTWHFYTGDERFARLWTRPADLINSGCVAAVECNYSVHAQTPRAVALWATYRKRWLARTWQEQGVRVLVDLNVAVEHATVNLLGVPYGWASFATRGSVERLGDLGAELELARTISGTPVPLLVVYGGGKAVTARCQQLGLVWIPEAQDEERGRGA